MSPAMRKVVVLAAAAAAGVGCGVQAEDPGRSDPPATATATSTNAARTQTVDTPPPGVTLPSRPSGLVVVDGPVTGTLTPDAITRFERRSAVEVDLRTSGEDDAFRDLCAGRVDIAESARLITREELAACRRNGLTVVKELQVASDAVVVATKNESDVGGDCLSVPDVRAIFQRGSTIDSWGDVGFDEIALETTGPDENSTIFTFFGQRVLGLPQATLADLRSDYDEKQLDREARLEVTGEGRFAEARRRALARRTAQRRSDGVRLRAMLRRAEARAEAPVLRAIARENAARAGQLVDGAAIARENARRVQLAKSEARREALEDFQASVRRRVDRRYLRDRETAMAAGTVGLLRFSYYEQFEEQLRPMEIDSGVRAPVAAPGTGTGTSTGTTATTTTTTTTPAPTGPQCVFPSRETISSGVYPLARPILLYTTRRGLTRSEVRQFLVSYLREAEDLANDNRLVPIDPTATNDQIEAVLGRELQRQRGSGARATGDGTATTPDGTSTSPTRTTPEDSGPGAIPGVSNRANSPTP